MDLDQRRRWDLLAQRFAELLKRLESGTFPSRDDWTLVLSIGTIAEELGRPRPVRMEVEQVFNGRGTLAVRSYFGPANRSHEIREGPSAGADVSPHFTDHPTLDDIDDDPNNRVPWEISLADVATFLAGTWLPTIELALPIEIRGRARRAVALLAKHPEGLVTKELAKLMKSDESNLNRDIGDAIAKGLVENARDGNGYRLTVLGRAWADENLPRSTASDGSATVSDGPRRKSDGKTKAR